MHKPPNGVGFGIFAFAYVHFIVTEKKTTGNAEFITLKIRVHCLVQNKLTKLPQWENLAARDLPKSVTLSVKKMELILVG